MPIECPIFLREMDQETFHATDRTVMGLAFGIHNELGRFLDERLYQDELGYRCREAGLSALREVGLRVMTITRNLLEDWGAFLDLPRKRGTPAHTPGCSQRLSSAFTRKW